MATGIFCTAAEVERKVGVQASATSSGIAYVDDYTTQAESYINVATGYNWSDAYTTLDVDVKGILKEAASNLVAIYVIIYDFTGFRYNTDATNRANFLVFRFNQCMKVLKEIGSEQFMLGV